VLDKDLLKGLSKKELIELIEKHAPHMEKSDIPEKKTAQAIPISVFDNKKLSALETICKYLKENAGYSYHEIAEMLNRNDRTIWTTYNNSKKKLETKFIVKEHEIELPISIFKERKLSVLETIAVYLKDEYGLTLHQIATLLNRNDRTIWTVYNRGKKKQWGNKLKMQQYSRDY